MTLLVTIIIVFLLFCCYINIKHIPIYFSESCYFQNVFLLLRVSKRQSINIYLPECQKVETDYLSVCLIFCTCSVCNGFCHIFRNAQFAELRLWPYNVIVVFDSHITFHHENNIFPITFTDTKTFYRNNYVN